MKILFVCTGNTCRSAMCEWYFRHLIGKSGTESWLECASAGTGTENGLPASEHAREVLRENGISGSHRSTELTPELAESADLIAVMTPRHRAAVCGLAPKAAGKVHLLMEYADKPDTPVDDPWMQSLDVYRACFAQVKPALENLLLQLITEHKSKLA